MLPKYASLSKLYERENRVRFDAKLLAQFSSLQAKASNLYASMVHNHQQEHKKTTQKDIIKYGPRKHEPLKSLERVERDKI